MAEVTGIPLVFVNNFPGPHMGGGEMHLMHLARGALAAGMSVSLVALPDSGVAAEAAAAGVSVVEDDLMSGTPLAVARRLELHLRDANAAIVHATGYYTNMLTRLAGPRLGARVVNAIHCEPDAASAGGGLRGKVSVGVRRAVDSATAAKVDVFIADSHVLARAVERAGVSSSRVHVVHNSVDPRALWAEAEAGELPHSLAALFARTQGAVTPRGESAVGAGEDARPLLVGTVGRLEPVKGIDMLFDAVPLVLAAHPHARFLIAGEGPQADALRARMGGDSALAESVELLGFVPSAAAFMRALDVYCLPSLSEGFNTTVLEALVLDVPVVATDVGGTGEVITDGETGRLVPPQQPAAFAKALSAMLQDGAARKRMAAAGRELVESEFTVDRMVSKTLEVYAALLGG